MRCFHCDGGLRNWERQDDPFTEHARWFPRCNFIRDLRGEAFVNAQAQRFPRVQHLVRLITFKKPSRIQWRIQDILERVQTYFAKFSENCIKRKLNRGGGGVCVPSPHLDPPMELPFIYLHIYLSAFTYFSNLSKISQ